jgi:hypothetical protein
VQLTCNLWSCSNPSHDRKTEQFYVRGSSCPLTAAPLYVRDSSAAAMVGDEPCANRNKDAV